MEARRYGIKIPRMDQQRPDTCTQGPLQANVVNTLRSSILNHGAYSLQNYGFLFPDDVVPGPYNVSFNNKKSNPISLNELKTSRSTKKLFKYNNSIVLGGKNYTRIVKAVFADKNVYNPLSKCKGIGFMMHELNEAIENENHRIINDKMNRHW